MNELSCLIDDLRKCAKTLNDSADRIENAFSGESPKEPEAPKLTLEDVRTVLATKARMGYRAEVRDLLLKYGAEKLSEIDPAKYPELLQDAEALSKDE